MLTHHGLNEYNPRATGRHGPGLPGFWIVEGFATFMEEGIYDVESGEWDLFNPRSHCMDVMQAAKPRQRIPWKALYAPQLLLRARAGAGSARGVRPRGRGARPQDGAGRAGRGRWVEAAVRRPAWLVLLGMLAACAIGKTAGVDRQRDIDGAWAIKNGETRLDATGTVATLFFLERTFVFEGMTSIRGVLEKKEVQLRGERIKIHITPERLEVVHGRERERLALPLTQVPVGGRVRYADGKLHVQ